MMTDKKIKLQDIAELLKVHPRTVLRIYKGQYNTPYHDGDNPELDFETLVERMEGDRRALKQLVEGREVFLTRQEAATLLNMSVSNFKLKKIKPALNRHKLTRYAKGRVLDFIYLQEAREQIKAEQENS